MERSWVMSPPSRERPQGAEAATSAIVPRVKAEAPPIIWKFEIRRGNKIPILGCAYRKSHPAILMVQSTQDRAAVDIPGPLSAARDRGILVQ
jgi:hypothetical protein